ncbi:hypothetical protein SAMD00019534_100340 [Acytostelium subglobosum LB1]|uniref:hypothetical protein n=1 Tax=Acytostelium subglobosum LB1 TaxID=1410327 RepID=UPI000644C180|nr:hypothetical protein SAMD00019534_100340 [Acytostelium subglobosum LB1]GAM26859.1 hypothetical protein SAMD00019534_100340 [Acytostelium subglobosum LB1]|eukprot:XP_012750127.1 hypothetical protein SAMD00019534_100340 [Acytostelium subglobosum LB1]
MNIPSPKDDDNDRSKTLRSFSIYEIGSKIMSVDLIKRLMTIPNITFNFGKLLSLAINSGNKDMITFIMKDGTESLVSTGHIICALKVGDLDTARAIIDMAPKLKISSDDCFDSLIDHIGEPNSKVTEDVIIEFATKLHNNSHPYLFKVLLKAAAKPLSVIKMVIKHYTSFYEGDKLVGGSIGDIINRYWSICLTKDTSVWMTGMIGWQD